MILNIKERIYISQILPKESDIITLMVCKNILNKVEFTSEEVEKYEIKSNSGIVSWNNSGDKEISLLDTEIKVIKDSVDEMDKNKKINIDMLDLCIKIKSM